MKQSAWGRACRVVQVFRIGLCTAVLASVGCGSGNQVQTVSAEGTITLDGKPLANAQVEFQPIDNRSPSYGTTDAKGYYTLMFTMSQAGVVPGQHIVRIMTGGVEDENGNVSAEEVPEKYNANTELTATVEQGGGPYDFNLQAE